MGARGVRLAVSATLRRKLGTARFLYVHGGGAAVRARLWARLGYRAILVFERRLDLPLAGAESPLPLTYEFLTEADAPGYAAHRPDLGATRVAQLFRSGDRCFVARLDGTIVNSRWVSLGPGPVRSLGVELELQPDEVYIHEVFTADAHRGLRIGPAAGLRMSHALAEDGWSRTISLVQAENLSGIRQAEGSGSRRTDMLAKLRIGPLHVPVRRAVRTRARFAREATPGIVRRKLRTARSLVERGGARAIARQVIAKLGYRAIGVYELDLTRPPTPLEPRIPLTYRFLEPAELDAFTAHCPAMDPATFARLLQDGNRCYVACRGSEIVSSGWVICGPASIESLGIDLQLAPDQAYVHLGFTGAEHRGQRALPAVGTRLANVLASEGRRVLIALVQANNVSGVRNAEHIGHRRTEMLAELSVGPLHLPVRRARTLDARFAHHRNGQEPVSVPEQDAAGAT